MSRWNVAMLPIAMVRTGSLPERLHKEDGCMTFKAKKCCTIYHRSKTEEGIKNLAPKVMLAILLIAE